MGALAFKDIGSRLMRGDISDIYTIYGKRKESLVQKASIKLNLPFSETLAPHPQYRRIAATPRLYMAAFGGHGSDAQSSDSGKIYPIGRKSHRRLSRVSQINPGNDGITIYPEEEIMEFQDLCDRVIRELTQKIWSNQNA